ncbi:copper-binding protein [Methylopila jiangsuensis]|uniref:Copper-binding protein n=1 Tax=Methylopila jiangsuensis TaxID=586230 RepID=A0A9W6JI87_9HYPH|nr:SCO family protein [Methylopila jiangsuensis]MDR6284491.1 protein SCO1/2 [Methylopila jiangsuensis]GLK78121.1 copper-binding protein [Methylopila jiangsuensis]
MTALRAVRLALWALVAVALVGLGGLGVGLWRLPAPEKTRTVSVASQIGGPFRLTSHRGEAVAEADMRGKPYLLFFGFTHCPDVCPTTLAELSRRLEQLGPDAGKVRTLFVTVDPERDTQEALAAYMTSFDPRIVALRGDQARTDEVVRSFKAAARKVPTKDGDYTMDHNAIVYMMNADGTFVGSLDPHEAEEIQLQKLRRLIAD